MVLIMVPRLPGAGDTTWKLICKQKYLLWRKIFTVDKNIFRKFKNVSVDSRDVDTVASSAMSARVAVRQPPSSSSQLSSFSLVSRSLPPVPPPVTPGSGQWRYGENARRNVTH